MKSKLTATLAVCALSAVPAFAGAVTLTFDGVTSFASINQFYNGGTDSAGASGTNQGISFAGAAVALANDELGPYYSNAPSPGAIMLPVGEQAALNAAAGFVGSASFFYSSNRNFSVSIFSGVDGGGNLISTFNLLANAQNGCSDTPLCHWDLASLSFNGLAKSIQFGSGYDLNGPETFAAFDNVTVTAPVPLPAAAWLLVSALGGLGAFARRRRAA